MEECVVDECDIVGKKSLCHDVIINVHNMHLVCDIHLFL